MSFSYAMSFQAAILTPIICSEDMINLLGKRPFANRSDDMDRWLDDNHGSERSAPPPLERPQPDPEPMPTPSPGVASTRVDDKML